MQILVIFNEVFLHEIDITNLHLEPYQILYLRRSIVRAT